MKRTRQTARPVCALIDSPRLCIVIYWTIGPWDLVSSSGSCCTHWFPITDPTERACHCVCDYLNDFITSSHVLHIWVFMLEPISFRAIDHGRSHQWLLMLCDVLQHALFQTMKPFSMCIHHILDFSQMDLLSGWQ